MRVATAATLTVRPRGEAQVRVSAAKDGDVRIRQERASDVTADGKQVESLDARGAEKPGDFHRTRRARQLQAGIPEHGRAERRQVSAVERRARHERQPPARIEIADLRDPPRRLEKLADAAEQSGDGQLHLVRRRHSGRARGQHRAEEQLRGEPLVPGRRLEMRPVGPHLAGNLFPQPAPIHVAPDARARQLGEQRSDHQQAHQIGRVVVRPDGASLLQMFLDVRAVLVEHLGHFRDEARVHRGVVLHVGKGHRDVERSRGNLHRARPLHTHPHRAVGLELSDGGHVRARPGGALAVTLREPPRLSIAPQLLQPPDLPGGFDVRARNEMVDASARDRRVVADSVPDRVEVVVERRHVAAHRLQRVLAAVLPFSEDRHLSAA